MNPGGGLLEKFKDEVLQKKQGGGQHKRSLQRKRCAFGVENGQKSQGISVSKMVWRLLGKNLLRVQRVHLASWSNRGGRSAAENENHEGDDKENPSESKNVCEQQLVGQ